MTLIGGFYLAKSGELAIPMYRQGWMDRLHLFHVMHSPNFPFFELIFSLANPYCGRVQTR